MKVSPTLFGFVVLCVVRYTIYLNIKQNLSHAWLLRLYTLGKLTHYDIFLSIKQNLSYAWILEPSALGN